MLPDLRKNFEIENAHLINFIHLTTDEKEMVRSWRNHESIRKWMYTDHIITVEEHNNFFLKIKNDNKNFYWVIKDKDKNYLGVLSLNRIDTRNKNAGFAIYANPNSSVPGIGRLIDQIAITLAFDIAGLHSLKLEVIEDNKGVINLHRKMGFVEEGRLKEFVLKDDIFKDVIIMGIINR